VKVAAVGQAMEQRTSIMDGKLKENENARRTLPCFLPLAEFPPSSTTITPAAEYPREEKRRK